MHVSLLRDRWRRARRRHRVAILPRGSSPAADYASAVARAQLRQAQDDSVVAIGGRSIFMGHGERTPRVFVLLHGFTDSPKQFEAARHATLRHGRQRLHSAPAASRRDAGANAFARADHGGRARGVRRFDDRHRARTRRHDHRRRVERRRKRRRVRSRSIATTCIALSSSRRRLPPAAFRTSSRTRS